jgi:hypothetical protein
MTYDAVINGGFNGYARRAYGCLPSTMLGYNPNQFHYQTDLNKAGHSTPYCDFCRLRKL